MEEIQKRGRKLKVVLEDDNVTVMAMIEEFRQDEYVMLLNAQKWKRVLYVGLWILELEYSHRY